MNSEAGQQSNVHWYCRICENGTKKIVEQMTSFENRIGMVENVVKNLDDSIKLLTEKLESIEVGDCPSKVNKGSSSFTQSTGLVAEIADELKERERRVLNVVFAGEVTSEKVEAFLDAAGTDKAKKIQEIETKSKRKIYIVTLTTEAQKWSLIKKSRNVGQTKEGLSNVFVNPDLTRSERDVQYKLRQELRRRRELGESVKISKGRIVNTNV